MSKVTIAAYGSRPPAPAGGTVPFSLSVSTWLRHYRDRRDRSAREIGF